jgi:multisubunit Na+/H+ antiporter MnhC subunit
MAKRAGPMVAVVLAPQDPNAAERLLSLVRYKAVVTEDERAPTARDNVADLLLNIFMLTGIVLVFCVVAGLAVAVLRRLGWGTSGDAMTLLHLEDRSRDSSQP